MFQVIGFTLKYLPTIIAAVSLVEALAQDAKGKDKKTIVLEAIYRILDSQGITVSPQLKEVAFKSIDTVVTVLNMLGIFQSDKTIIPTEIEIETLSQILPTDTVRRSAEILRGENEGRLDELERELTEDPARTVLDAHPEPVAKE